MKPVASIFALMTIAYPACAQTPGQGLSLLGVTVGAPLSGPPCDPNDPAFASVPKETNNPNLKCLHRVAFLGPTTYSVELASETRQSFPYLTMNPFLEVEGGTVQQLSAHTKGVESQQLVFSDLKTKFGKPTKEGTEAKQNGFGATFTVITAEWRLPSGIVRFWGALGSIDDGVIELNSTAWENRPRAARPSL